MTYYRSRRGAAVTLPPDSEQRLGDDSGPLTAEAERSFREGIRLFAARRLRIAAEADDVAQETLRRALEALKTGRIANTGSLPAFLFQTARNICMQRLRSARREVNALRRFAATPAGRAPSDPLANLIDEEDQKAVRLALEKLDPDDSEVLRLTFRDELDAEEIGQRFGIAPGTVRVRRHRAIRRLAKLLGVTNRGEREHKE